MSQTLVSTTSASTLASGAATAVANTTGTRRVVRSVWRHGAAAGLVAAVVTVAIAGLADVAGVSFVHDGKDIPLLAFAEFTFLCALIGVAIAAVLARRASRPRSTFVKTTVMLTVLSVVPGFIMPFEAAAGPVLAAVHVAAAAIVIPTIARRLDSHA